MKPIGGYFELELPRGNQDFPHALCPALNSGRHALEFILRQLGNRAKMIHLPYYTCDVVLEPIKRMNIGYQFYHIDENLEIKDMPNLQEGHYLIANNYFGIKDEYIRTLFYELGPKLIVDNAQAYFAEERLGMKAFYSPRKFVGVPDGGFAWTPQEVDIVLPQCFSTDRSSHLLRRIDSGSTSGYREFKNNSHTLSEEPMKKMSDLTYRLLESVNFDAVKDRRMSNFEYLHRELSATNMFKIPDIKKFTCPMIYPYLTDNSGLRNNLISHNVFIAQYWPNVLEWCESNSVEGQLAKSLLPLPIDQRYGEEDMSNLIILIKTKK